MREARRSRRLEGIGEMDRLLKLFQHFEFYSGALNTLETEESTSGVYPSQFTRTYVLSLQ
jgi:hypothetical protein